MIKTIEESGREYGVMFYSLMCIFLQKKFGDIKIYTYICRKNETMPTLLRIFGLRFFFYLDEHLPIHLHVECGVKLAEDYYGDD